MPLRLALGARTWRARWPFVLLTALACVVFVSLGRWQWSRGDYRTAQWAAFDNADAAARVTTADALDSIERYARVEVRGEYDRERQILLDDLTQGGRVGYEVLTPLRLADGSALLVDRGFVPGTGYRD
ncbi:MAG: SURF1 family protein, partial [Proteobacteria bacterium]